MAGELLEADRPALEIASPKALNYRAPDIAEPSLGEGTQDRCMTKIRCRRLIQIAIGKVGTEVKFLRNAGTGGGPGTFQSFQIFRIPFIRLHRGETRFQFPYLGIRTQPRIQNRGPKASFDQSLRCRNATEPGADDVNQVNLAMLTLEYRFGIAEAIPAFPCRLDDEFSE
jgi:hypothetical protein